MTKKQPEKKNRFGQSVVEYLLLFAAVVVVLLTFLNPAGPFKNSIEKTVNGPVAQLEDMAANLQFPP